MTLSLGGSHFGDLSLWCLGVRKWQERLRQTQGRKDRCLCLIMKFWFLRVSVMSFKTAAEVVNARFLKMFLESYKLFTAESYDDDV